jgi:hypothetical protein
MKIHPALVRLTVINMGICFLMFLLLYLYTPAENRLLGVALGWIFWLGMIARIEPLFFSDDTRVTWYSKEFGTGTLVALLLNVVGAILCNFIAYTCVV